MLAEKIRAVGADPITAAVRRFFETVVAGAKTSDARKATEKRHDRLARRVADLAGERGAVVARRVSGQQEADGGGGLALLAADIERLRNLRISANQRGAATQPAQDGVVREVQDARLMLTQAQDTAVASALTLYLGELDAAMLKALGELDTVVGRVGFNGKPVWGVTRPLYLRLRNRAAMRGEL